MAINLNIFKWKLFEVAEKYMERSKYAYTYIFGREICTWLCCSHINTVTKALHFEEPLAMPLRGVWVIDKEQDLLASEGRGWQMRPGCA